jgi:TRAP-type C4-dicarboxylate transport system permease large subunit
MSATTMAPPSGKGKIPLLDWVVGLPTITLLLLVLVIGTGEMIHGQLLKLGENMFGNKADHVQYFMLRDNPVKPECNANVDLDAEVARIVATSHAKKDADLDELFGARTVDPAKIRESLKESLVECKFKHDIYEASLKHITPAVVAYRTLETSFFGLFQFGTDNRPMILLLLMGVTILAATLGYENIALAPPRYALDYKCQAWTMLFAAVFSLWSCVRYYQISKDSGIAIEDPEIYYAWIAMFGTLLLLTIWQILNPREPRDKSHPGTISNALKTMPLAGTMTIFAGVYFLLKDHPSGLAIYINALMDIPMIPLQLALFIWAGMLFKQTRVVDLFMNLVRPWRLSPEALTYFILLAAAIPTANTGGSGAFVMAVGAIIYHEIRAVGGSSQFALAASAMSGSLGVVLRPCLLIVAIVAVNRSVTSNELYYWGNWVFFLTSSLFFIASQWRREQHTINIASPMEAVPAMLRQLPTLIPYAIVVAVVVLVYEHVLNTPLNEISAPIIMPVMLLLIVVVDKILLARGIGPDSQQLAFAMHRERTATASVRVATTESVDHLGGYMYLILLSQAMGGVIERSGIIHLAPDQFGSAWTAMAFMAVALVFLGMFMEPLGAIFLVSGSLAPLAIKSGVDPVHFWMMVLVAFELGYLMPPVALNQLLARQVVGDEIIDEADREVANKSFYRRYERWILPCAVMSVGLALVSFVPLIVREFPDFSAWLSTWMAPPAK